MAALFEVTLKSYAEEQPERLLSRQEYLDVVRSYEGQRFSPPARPSCALDGALPSSASAKPARREVPVTRTARPRPGRQTAPPGAAPAASRPVRRPVRPDTLHANRHDQILPAAEHVNSSAIRLRRRHQHTAGVGARALS